MRIRFIALTTLLCVTFSTPLLANDTPTTRFFGRVLSRQNNLEEYASSVSRTFVALFSDEIFSADFFERTPPATFYNTVAPNYVATSATDYTIIEEPFGGFNFRSVPLGNYWFCKFDIDDDMQLDDILQVPDLMLSGCQYVSLNSPKDYKQNYYTSEIGFWFDDIVEQESEEQPESVSSSSECQTGE